jgi:2-polyprenyl-3-methyl-5-hydroxy-6-metoxy-1,4-benzoquinol methylase
MFNKLIKYNSIVSEYWKSSDNKIENSVANETLIRLIGNLKFKYKNKKVLDVGIGDGANLLEFRKRGAKIYGVDIREKKIADFCKKNKLSKKNFYVNDLNISFPNIGVKYDLIICKDTFYYLNKNKRLNFLKFCKSILKKKGILIVQFIQTELCEIKKKNLLDYSLSNNLRNEKSYHEKNNPITYFTKKEIINLIRRSKLKLKNNIFDITTHIKNKKFITVNRYLVLMY